MKEIPIKNKKNEILGYAKCDDCDYEMLSCYKWIYNSRGYVATMVKKDNKDWRKGYKCVYMHRLIMECPDNLQVDHINHEKTDNRRVNLRNVTASENALNKLPVEKIKIEKIKKYGKGIPYRTYLVDGKLKHRTF